MTFSTWAPTCAGRNAKARKRNPLRVTEEQVVWLENKIDLFNAALAPLDSFVLPGGSQASAHLHHARTVTRRAERTSRGLLPKSR